MGLQERAGCVLVVNADDIMKAEDLVATRMAALLREFTFVDEVKAIFLDPQNLSLQVTRRAEDIARKRQPCVNSAVNLR